MKTFWSKARHILAQMLIAAGKAAMLEQGLIE